MIALFYRGEFTWNGHPTYHKIIKGKGTHFLFVHEENEGWSIISSTTGKATGIFSEKATEYPTSPDAEWRFRFTDEESGIEVIEVVIPDVLPVGPPISVTCL